MADCNDAGDKESNLKSELCLKLEYPAGLAKKTKSLEQNAQSVLSGLANQTPGKPPSCKFKMPISDTVHGHPIGR